MEWDAVFDEVAERQPGATEAVIARFVAEVARPMSADEIREIAEHQQNPFPAGDPFHTEWRPIDAGAWRLPDKPLPASYLSLLRWSNGGEFRSGDRWFQLLPALDRQHGVRAIMLAYHVPEYMPGALPIAFDGAGAFYLLDMRHDMVDGEFPVGCVHSGELSWEDDAYEEIATTLEGAFCGR